jgi:hypothetical protein
MSSAELITRWVSSQASKEWGMWDVPEFNTVIYEVEVLGSLVSHIQ